jgi:hypothetical protein
LPHVLFTLLSRLLNLLSFVEYRMKLIDCIDGINAINDSYLQAAVAAVLSIS